MTRPRLGASAIHAPVVNRREWEQLAVTISNIPVRMAPFVVPKRSAHHLVLLAADAHVCLRKRELQGEAVRTLDMAQHDIHVTCANTPPHEIGWQALDTSGACQAVHVQLHAEVTDRLREEHSVVQPRAEIMTGLLRDPLLENLMHSLARVVQQDEESDSLYVDTISELIGLQLLREHSCQEQTEQRLHRGLPPARLRRVQEYVSDHMHEEIRLADLAQEAKLSPYHFLRAFKTATGLTPREYVQQCRVERTKTLLEGSDMPIERIAEAVGFAGQSHLATRFRNATGITPSAYRRQRQR